VTLCRTAFNEYQLCTEKGARTTLFACSEGVTIVPVPREMGVLLQSGSYCDCHR